MPTSTPQCFEYCRLISLLSLCLFSPRVASAASADASAWPRRTLKAHRTIVRVHNTRRILSKAACSVRHCHPGSCKRALGLSSSSRRFEAVSYSCQKCLYGRVVSIRRQIETHIVEGSPAVLSVYVEFIAGIVHKQQFTPTHRMHTCLVASFIGLYLLNIYGGL